MTERETDDRAHGEDDLRCPACGTPNRGGDRFCANCGASLSPPDRSPAQAPDQGAPTQESAAWVLGARPVTVIGGGLLLLVLAVVLLAVGQRDRTGTIVMLSICTAPLGLLTLAIGVARYIAGTARQK